MKKCPRCGAEVPSGSKFCIHCGFDLTKHPISSSGTSQNSRTPTFCPRCGQRIQNGMKFCQHCGYPINQGNPIGNQIPSQQPSYQPNYSKRPHYNPAFNQAKKYSRDYLNWLVNTIKNPAKIDSNAHHYYGITSIIAGFILMLLSINNIINNLSDIINNIINKYTGGIDSSAVTSAIDKVKNGSIEDAILLCTIGFIVYWLAGFWGRKLTANRHLDPFKYSNQLATFTNTALVCETVLFILTLLSAYTLAFYVINIVFVIYNVGLICSIVRKSTSPNKIYVAIIASCCVPLAIILMMSI